MDRHAGLGGIQDTSVSTDNKDVNLNVDGRHPDVQIDMQGRKHGNIAFSVSGGGGRNDYRILNHKPRINGRELIDDHMVSYYLQDGLIINCGDADGFSSLVMPPGEVDF